MAAATTPIYTRTPDVQWTTTNVQTANTTRDLTTGTSYPLFTADATEGGRVERVLIRSIGTNVATVMRIWLNNGSAIGTSANNTLLHEITLPTTTSTEVAALPPYEVGLGLAMPAGYKLYVTIGTAVAGGFHVIAIGGKY